MYRFSCFTVLFLAAGIVFSMFLRDPGINGYERSKFADMVYGRAYKPFVYRVMLPVAIRIVAGALPAGAERYLKGSMAENRFVRELFSVYKWEREYFIEYSIAAVMMFLFLLGFAFALRFLFTGVYGSTGALKDLVPSLAVLGLPPFFQRCNYIYDFPALLFFTLGLGLMIRTRWKGFIVVFTLGCLNKETAVLLSMVFVLHFLRDQETNRTVFRRLLLAQAAIFLVIKASLFLIFRDNPGSFVETHLAYNLFWLKSYPLATAVSWIFIALLVFYRWSEKPVFLRNSLWILIPLLATTLFFGYLDELRDYYEVYPVVLLLALHSLSHIGGRALVSTDNYRGS